MTIQLNLLGCDNNKTEFKCVPFRFAVLYKKQVFEQINANSLFALEKSPWNALVKWYVSGVVCHKEQQSIVKGPENSLHDAETL